MEKMSRSVSLVAAVLLSFFLLFTLSFVLCSFTWANHDLMLLGPYPEKLEFILSVPSRRTGQRVRDIVISLPHTLYFSISC